jgi:diguanylate cyclase (GGDEF)-like protein/PAS domain S-box-containing protein
MILGPDSLLLVDSDASHRDRIIQCLSKMGYEVSPAANGQDALNWIRSHHVDLVLLDAGTSEVNGLEDLALLREVYPAEQLPIIMLLSGESGEETTSALAAGANDFTTKPIVFPVLLARIQAQLSRKHAEEALRESEQRYALAARVANDGLWDWDLVADKICYTPRWKAMLGWEEHEISNDPDEWFRRIHPEDIDRIRADINAHLEEQTPHFEGEYRILHRDGNYLWMLCRGLAVRGADGKACRMAGSQTDITRGKVVDILTGLPNRVLFMDRLGRSFERAKRHQEKTLALIFLDLDDFKLINDNHGHLVGDQLLVAIAGRVEATVRSSDSIVRFGRNHTIARLGGDEFTILLEDIAGVLDATRVADRIAKELAIPFVVGNRELFPTASMGIALYHPAYHTPDELLRDADTAMYSAKARGNGRYEVFDPDMRARAVARQQMGAELLCALEKKEFDVHYQSVVSLDTGRIWGFEALLRWRHATRGVILPKEFLPVAEESGLIVSIGQWVLETACQQMRIWQSRFSEDPALLISINLSARQLLQSELVQQCRVILGETKLLQSSLNLEFTESVIMPDPESTIRLMYQLKSLGIKIALDDFGTGYSSLGSLNRFPIDSLKIDGSFVSRMMKDDEVVRTLVTVGRNLGLRVIAEGVETAEQAEKLRELGCELAQGYYFSIPVSAQEATDMLAANRHWAATSKAAKLARGDRLPLTPSPTRIYLGSG